MKSLKFSALINSKMNLFEVGFPDGETAEWTLALSRFNILIHARDAECVTTWQHCVLVVALAKGATQLILRFLILNSVKLRIRHLPHTP